MSIKESIAATIRRLNLHGIVMRIPIFGKALYEALSCEFERVNDYRKIVLSSTVANKDIDESTIDDNEKKYGIIPISTDTKEERICRIVEKAQRDGNGGIDWFQSQIQAAGFELYVHLNTKTVSSVPQFGNHQFGQILFGGSVNYTDPRTIDGIIVASSPNGNVGALYENFGTFQFGSQQFGEKVEGTTNPRPREFTISSDPNTWGYFFFLSPYEDRIANSAEFLQLTEEQWRYLRRLIMQLKHLRNWCIAQVEVVENPKPIIQETMITGDGFRMITDDNLTMTTQARD